MSALGEFPAKRWCLPSQTFQARSDARCAESARHGIIPGNDGIAVGMYVQISGTEGYGLQIREAPGVGSQPKFLAMDAEVFLVIDGPKDQDGYTWWLLKAPYDETRTGWAASKYLQAIIEN